MKSLSLLDMYTDYLISSRTLNHDHRVVASN